MKESDGRVRKTQLCTAFAAAAMCLASLAGCGGPQAGTTDMSKDQRQAAASHTVKAGEEGFYAITESSATLSGEGRAQLRVYVSRAGLVQDRQPHPAVLAGILAGEAFDFDTFLGYLSAGDTVNIEVGDGKQQVKIDYKVGRTPSIPVSVFPEDVVKKTLVDAPGGWSLMSGVTAGSAAARLLAWNESAETAKAFTLRESSAQVRLDGGANETIVAFRVPQSGYYAMHDSWATISAGGAAEARIYVGRGAKGPTAAIPLTVGNRVSLNRDLGYMSRGEIAYLALASSKPAVVDFAASIFEWAPRRAPLRVRRGEDGLFDVFEPAAPRKAIDIPADRWITVPAQEQDATEAIRKAIVDASNLQQRDGDGGDGGYAGVRLEAGKRYVVGSNQNKGPIFEIKDRQRLVFDGNGATLFVNSPELQRERLNLFTTSASRDIAIADFEVKTNGIAFSVGEVLEVGPMDKGNQTVTFRLLPGQPNPVADLRRSGMAEGYAYDATIPGRAAVGSWSHFPGANVKPQLEPTDKPGIYRHTVTRTNQSISVGDKWLIKNKGSGIQFLTTGGKSENITLARVIDRGCAGGYLLFWQTSGINILDCTFEPQGTDWISSTSDGVHGRAREGVWIENTLIRGVCEDVMNTYGVSLAAQGDGRPDDNTVTLGVFNNSRRDKDGEYILGDVSDDIVQAGEELVFFDPAEGRVLGRATIREKTGNRCVLTNSVPGVKTWRKGAGKHNATMIYSTRGAARFFIRDSRIMDSLRFGVFIKARGGTVFNTHFEGLASNAIFAANEPEWPEGPPPTHLWLQGNTFYQNGYGYTGLNRAFLSVDPGEISIYTRRLRNPDVPPGWGAHITRGQYPISHMRIEGNTFLDWRGMGIAVRNTRSLIISDNLFLPPIDDKTMRATLAKDAAMARDGAGQYAAIFMDSIDGGLISGNRFIGLPEGDQGIVHDQDVQGVVEADNTAGKTNLANVGVALSFTEWFGSTSLEATGVEAAQDRVELHGATHAVGRLGAGLAFNGKDDYAVLRASADLLGKPVEQMTLALWVRPAAGGQSEQVIYSHGDAQNGVVMAIAGGRFVAGVWQSGKGAWLDLGPAVTGIWQHLALVYDGQSGSLRGFADGMAVSSAKSGLPSQLAVISTDAALGRAVPGTRIGTDQVVTANAPYCGLVDEFRLFHSAQVDVGFLALQRPAASR